jgi:hypothetical protein
MTYRPKRFAIVHMAPTFDSVPGLCSAAHMLAEAGAFVDVYTSADKHFRAPKPSHERITIRPAFALPRGERRGVFRFLPGRFQNYQRRLQVSSEHRRLPFSAVIAADPEGLTYAWDSLFKGVRIPFVYFSLEILFQRECKTDALRVLKEREIALSRQCKFAIIQDAERARLLAAENGICDRQFRLIPNSPLGEASDKRSTWLRDRLGIASNQLIVLHAGSPYLWTGLPHLLISAAKWPENWSLVIQTRVSPEALGDYWSLIELLASRVRAKILSEPLQASEYSELVASADVGCAFYLPQPSCRWIDDNLRFIGRSSGKAAYYLRNGLPILTNGDTNLSELVRKAGCGEIVDSPFETNGALTRIVENYQTYSRNARSCFRELFSFRDYFKPVVHELFAL